MSRAVFSPLYLTWDQTMVEVMKIMATSFKRSHACTATLSAPNLAAGHCWPTPPPIPGDSRTISGKPGSVPYRVTGPLSWVQEPQKDCRHWSSSCMALGLLWGDTLCPRAEKPQQDDMRGKITFKIKPHTFQRCSESSNIPCVHQDPETPQKLRQNCECLLRRYRSAVDCRRGRGSGCCRLGYGISPLGGGHH